MKVNAFIQARMSSSRLPGKVLKKIEDKPMLLHIVERLKHAEALHDIVVLTSDEHSDDPIATLCQQHDIPFFRGSLTNVLSRYAKASETFPAEHIVRITADCPLVDSQLVDNIVSKHLELNADYTSNCHPAMYPDGLDVEVMKCTALQLANTEAQSLHQKEHVTPYLYTHPEQFSCANYDAPERLPSLRLTVDHPEDLALVKKIYNVLYAKNNNFNLGQVLNLLSLNPDWLIENEKFHRNEAIKTELSKEPGQ